MNFDPTNLILIVAALMVFWKLRSVLGQRNGFERPPTSSNAVIEPTSNVIALKPTEVSKIPVWKNITDEGSPLALGLEKIAAVQPSFSVPEFMAGAKSAYEMILSDFAKGDKKGLKPMLSASVFESFINVIDRHVAKGESKLFQFVGHKETKLLDANLNGNRATLEVKFASEMISATLDQTGKTVEGDAQAIVDVDEIWTFEREVSSRDPNWKLVATRDSYE